MRRYRFIIISITVVWGFTICSSMAQELPLVKSFSRTEYGGQKQNWDIDQLSDGTMCFANSSGLLMFDGVNWTNHPLPNRQFLRTIEASRDTLYAGAYGEFGYWHFHSDSLRWIYQSLSEELGLEELEREEIWNIVVSERDIYYQSFGSIFAFDQDEMAARKIGTPSNIQFIHSVSGDLVLQVHGHGLCRMEDDTVRSIYAIPQWANERITGVEELADGHWLLSAESGLLMTLTDGRLDHFDHELGAEFDDFQINKLKVLKNGTIAIGTISHGLFLVQPDGHLLYHFTKENGMMNNTILSLFEDNVGNLWVGLDDGIAMVNLNNPLNYWRDYRGQIGTPYAAARFQDALYLGSNQGLYVRSDGDSHYKPVTGAGGQVWELLQVDDHLFAGHNRGLLVIDQAGEASLIPGWGIWNLSVVQKEPLILLAGTYNGISFIEQKDNGQFEVRNSSFPHAARHVSISDQNEVWVASPYKGVYRLQLDGDMVFSEPPGLPHSMRIRLDRWDNQVVAIASESDHYQFDPPCDCFKMHDRLSSTTMSGKYYSGRASTYFEVTSDAVHYYNNDNAVVTLDLAVVENHRPFIILDDSEYLICLDDGYAIFQPDAYTSWSPHRAPTVSSVEAFDKQGLSVSKSHLFADHVSTINLPRSTKRVRLAYTHRSFIRDAKYRSRLHGFDQDWTRWESTHFREFTNLHAGSYRFDLSSTLGPESSSFTLMLEPKWYETNAAKALVCLLVLGLVLGINRLYHWRIERHKRRLQIEHERELNRQRLLLRNEILEKDVIVKSKQLANSTMSLVQKNDVLNNILDGLQEVKKGLGIRLPDKYYHNLVRLIRQNLSSDEDAGLFETNFDQVHDQFFSELHQDFPSLSPGELKLAAYLKMNLSSKEIAQLLKISVRGVENKRYRLRKKMGLASGDNLMTSLLKY